MLQQNSKFESLNFDTHPTNGNYDTINVSVDFEKIVSGYAQAYAHELHRRNPLRYEASKLNEESLEFYFKYLIWIRLQCVHDSCTEFRRVRALMVPDWIAFILDKLGEAFYPKMGLHIVPTCPSEVEFLKCLKVEKALSLKDKAPKEISVLLFGDALDISTRLRAFRDDGVGMSDNAFPRSKEGDAEVMSTMLIDDYVKSIKEVTPIKTYVSAFLGLNMLGSHAWDALFRIRYDDIEYIRDRLIHEESLF